MPELILESCLSAKGNAHGPATPPTVARQGLQDKENHLASLSSNFILKTSSEENPVDTVERHYCTELGIEILTTYHHLLTPKEQEHRQLNHQGQASKLHKLFWGSIEMDWLTLIPPIFNLYVYVSFAILLALRIFIFSHVQFHV